MGMKNLPPPPRVDASPSPPGSWSLKVGGVLNMKPPWVNLENAGIAILRREGYTRAAPCLFLFMGRAELYSLRLHYCCCFLFASAIILRHCIYCLCHKFTSFTLAEKIFHCQRINKARMKYADAQNSFHH